ncbi:MAG: hypothetical protein IKZ39_05355 [Lachnospiraceae bacterium]|nr:hypothetical protein [Lachnospiraceae bacterium]
MALFPGLGGKGGKRGVTKFTDDYTIEYYTDAKGREKERAVYIGPHIPVREDLKSLRLKLTGIVMLALITVALILICHLINHTTAWWFGTVIPLGAALFPAMFILFSLSNLPFDGKSMQRDGYMHGIIRLFNCFGAITAIMAVELVFEIIYRIANSDWMFVSGDIVFAILVVFTIVLSIAAIAILRSIDVDETELGVERTQNNQ